MLVTFSSSPDWYHFGPSATTKPGRRHIGQNLAAHRAATASAKVAGRSILPKNDKIIVDLLRKSEVYMVHPGPLRDVRDRHDALGRDAMDAASVRRVRSPDETLAAYGEVVWSWRRDRGVYPARLVAGSATVTINAAHRGEHEGNRNTIARGKPV